MGKNHIVSTPYEGIVMLSFSRTVTRRKSTRPRSGQILRPDAQSRITLLGLRVDIADFHTDIFTKQRLRALETSSRSGFGFLLLLFKGPVCVWSVWVTLVAWVGKNEQQQATATTTS